MEQETYIKIILGIMFIIAIAGISFLIGVSFCNCLVPIKADNKVYQGPVRPETDEEYFRATGISRPRETDQEEEKGGKN